LENSRSKVAAADRRLAKSSIAAPLSATPAASLVDGSPDLVADQAADHAAIVLPVAGN